MNLVVRGRGAHVSDRVRDLVHRRLARLERRSSQIDRLEVDLIAEKDRKGSYRVEASCRTPRRTFRAAGEGVDFEAALDRLVHRLERQIVDDRGRRRARLIEGATRAKTSGAQVRERPIR
ncbi:MAG: ribosome hibernation-promoting factor, HPF/YfiA family [Actinomycetota bacterium]